MSTVLHLSTAVSAVSRFESFQAQLPLPVASAERGHSGFITFDFGEQQSRDRITNAPQFDWHLWVYMCDWDLYKGQSRLLWRRESDNALAGAILGQLVGETLLGFDYDEGDDCFLMRFSGGFSLHLDPDFFGFDPTDDIFMLFRHGEADCLSYSPDRRFYRAA
jgi:hypothetical protein